MSLTTKPTVAFFGATGGSTLAALVPALKDSYPCLALARTPSKLTSLLLEKGVPQSALDNYLHITEGDVLNPADVKKALITHPNNGNGAERCADIIVSGIGVRAFGSKEEITICRNGMANILSGLRELANKVEGKEQTKRPLLVALSTTGITTGEQKRDVPLLMKPLYVYGLHAPHQDKIAMEALIEEEMNKGEERFIKGWVMVKPSLLTDGAAKGLEKVKEGTEVTPAVGYNVNRDDVGLWMFERLIKEGAGKWVGQKVTLTY